MHGVLGNSSAARRRASALARRPQNPAARVSIALSRRDVFGLRRRLPDRRVERTRARRVPGHHSHPLMSKSSPVVAITGAFDDLKSRDFRFLEEAGKIGDITALVWSDDVILKRLGKLPKFPQAERLYFLQAIRFISRVRLVSKEFDADA